MNNRFELDFMFMDEMVYFKKTSKFIFIRKN